MRLLGIGLHEMTKFCAFTELPRPIFHSFYDKVVKKMPTANDATISIEKEENGMRVSGDGSWRKRGFTSLYDLVTLIGNNCGKIVDCIVKSKYCKAYEY